jgi:Undecaprenyl-phosphate glucose phosphotransferase
MLQSDTADAILTARSAPLADISATRSTLISPAVLGAAVRALEAGFVTALGVALAFGYVEADQRGLILHCAAAVAAGVLTPLMFGALGLYTLPSYLNPVRALGPVVAGWSVAVIDVIAAGFFLKIGADFSRFWLAAWFIAGACGLAAGRFALGGQSRRWSKEGRLNRRAVIYGSGPACAALVCALEADKGTDIRICGVFDDRGEDRAGASTAGYPNRGRLDDLIGFARNSRVDMVLLALPISAEMRLMCLLQKLWVLPADIRLAACASRLKLARRAYSYVGNVALVALADKPISDWGTIVKAVFDKVVAVLAVIALAPVMALTALAIRLDSKGPVIFRQKRYGFNNELIEVFKFRSMYTDKTDHTASKLVTKDDPRVTKVGRFIRKTSLDELPQLFNVLLGGLSLVGPRPHAVSAKAAGKLYDKAVDSYFARHKVKPGITGWAQINGWRGETDTEEKLVKRIEHDLEYIENWSLALDLYILAKTPVSLIKTENAY